MSISLSTNTFIFTAIGITLLCLFLGFAANRWIFSGDKSSMVKFMLYGLSVSIIINLVIWFFMVRGNGKKNVADIAYEMISPNQPNSTESIATTSAEDYIKRMTNSNVF